MTGKLRSLDGGRVVTIVDVTSRGVLVEDVASFRRVVLRSLKGWEYLPPGDGDTR